MESDHDQAAARLEAADRAPAEAAAAPAPGSGPPFIVTKEHRRFTEFADACRRDRYIGLCYGPPGVGKTLSARRYASWYHLAPLLRRGHKHYTQGRDRPDWHTIVYTPTVSATPRIIDKELCDLSANLSVIRTPDPFDARSLADPHASSAFVELLIVDEADRLKTPGLEQLRDTTTAASSA